MELLEKLHHDFPDIHFIQGDIFSWSPSTKTIFFEDPQNYYHLLHETAHASLGHSTYQRDIELLVMEREAWHYAVHTLAPKYGIPMSLDDNIVQDALDTYREWLHARSCCPKCSAVGVEQEKHQYFCVACHQVWCVNEARSCRLIRKISI